MSALERWTHEVEDLFRISCRFECPEPVLIADVVAATHLYPHRAGSGEQRREARAGVATWMLSLLCTDDGGILTIEDDGVGLPDSLPGRGGLGLHIMGYRANMVGGTLEVRRGVGRRDGGIVSVSAPGEVEEGAMKKHGVFVVDDHPIVRQGLALLINQEPDLVVCGEAEEGQTALRALADVRPDVLVLDISLPGPDGMELLKTIRSTDPALPILVLSMHDEAVYAERALRAGANGYIMKQEATDKVLVALRRILTGDVYVSDRSPPSCWDGWWPNPSTRADAGREPQRPRTRSVPAHRGWSWNPPDRRGTAPQRQDRGIVSGAHQGQARRAQRARR